MINPKHIVDGWWHTIFKDEKFEPIAKNRLAKCMTNECGFFSAFGGGFCKECGCPVRVKVRCSECECGVKKW